MFSVARLLSANLGSYFTRASLPLSLPPCTSLVMYEAVSQDLCCGRALTNLQTGFAMGLIQFLGGSLPPYTLGSSLVAQLGGTGVSPVKWWWTSLRGCCESFLVWCVVSGFPYVFYASQRTHPGSPQGLESCYNFQIHAPEEGQRPPSCMCRP